MSRTRRRRRHQLKEGASASSLDPAGMETDVIGQKPGRSGGDEVGEEEKEPEELTAALDHFLPFRGP